MQIRFNWRDWWKAERFGVVYAVLFSLTCPIIGILAAIADGAPFNPWFAWMGLFVAAWCFVYCAGWQMLMRGVAALRARMGWITYAPAPDQLDPPGR